jgi:N utilization substance protein A
MQRIRHAERDMIYEEFKDRAGEIITGTVRRFDRSDVIIDLGRFEGIMLNRERVATEEYAVGDRIRAYVVAVENGARGPEIILSRSHPNFVRRLFETEVAEIADKTVEIKGIAREAGHRTKIAVWSANEKVDPVGACVGMRGARVKNIVRELNNEKVDIIRWSTDTKELVLEALKPAKVKSIVLDEAKHNVLIKVEADQLSLAIGKRGQNARLTSRLTGWDISIERDESAREAFEQNVAKGVDSLASALSVTVDIARKLMDAGMVSADVIMMAEPSDIADAIGCDVATAEEIYNAARTNLSKSAS